MALTTPTELPGPVDVVFQRTLLDNAMAVCPYFIGSDPAEIAKNDGTFTAKWRRIENLAPTTTPLTPLSGTFALPTRPGTQPSSNDLTATVQKYGVVIYLTEEVDLINFTGQTDKLMEILGINAGQSLNRLQRNELEDNSTIEFGGAATTATDVTAKIVANDVKKIVNLLQRNNAMKFTPMSTGSINIGTSAQRAAYWGICHSDIEEDIRSFTGFVGVENYAGQVAVETGEIGSFGGVRFISTSEASIDAAAGGTAAAGVRSATGTLADLYPTVIMGRSHHGSVGLGLRHIKEIYMAGDELPAVQMIQHAAGSAGTGDAFNEVRSLAWKSWHAAKVFTNATTPTTGEWGFSLVTGAGELA